MSRFPPSSCVPGRSKEHRCKWDETMVQFLLWISNTWLRPGFISVHKIANIFILSRKQKPFLYQWFIVNQAFEGSICKNSNKWTKIFKTKPSRKEPFGLKNWFGNKMWCSDFFFLMPFIECSPSISCIKPTTESNSTFSIGSSIRSIIWDLSGETWTDTGFHQQRSKCRIDSWCFDTTPLLLRKAAHLLTCSGKVRSCILCCRTTSKQCRHFKGRWIWQANMGELVALLPIGLFKLTWLSFSFPFCSS